ncbi:hypothetical protein [Neisseria iguanae]|uniref:IS256 family transposase n=1 Tax=Neisseria iguanae TaxID=90242 RepID=A0A2P7TY65_9NEIS|nr:hypothetical protein [Neisseria iguanae]PSJ79645.1 hypothetical protein C7N83_10980 [Neisseria iguanae]
MTKPAFDFETALRHLQSGQALTGKDGPLTPPIKQPAEAALEAETEQYLEQKQLQPNQRNGHSKKPSKPYRRHWKLLEPGEVRLAQIQWGWP